MIRFEGWMEAKSPIMHGGDEKTGSTVVLRTITMWVPEYGEFARLPYLSGNGIRGKLRRLLMRDFLGRLGVEPEKLSTKLYHVLFTGGALESTDATSGQIDLELRKRIRDLLPPVSLLGAAVGNQMVPGKLRLGHCFPISREYRAYLPEFLRDDPRAEQHVYAFTDESFQTRRDELRAEREEDEQAMQMKVNFQCFVPGTRFYHWFALEYATPLEESCFGHMMELFRASPFLGGSASSGHGEVIFEYRPELPSGEDFRSFVDEKAGEIQDLFAELEARL